MGELASRIISYMKSKSYRVFTGAGFYNIVYVEGMNADGSLNSDAPNCFNDRRIVIEIDPNPKIVGNWDATSEPGSHYTHHPMNPLGAARIAFGQYQAWRVGMHGRTDRHEALIQVAPITVHRDLNKDGLRTSDSTTTGLFGINQHWGYDLPINDIATASAGCLVGRCRQGHREFMRTLKTDRRYKSDHTYMITTTVIAGDDLVRTSMS